MRGGTARTAPATSQSVLIHQGSYPQTLLTDVFGLQPGAALVVAQAMYPKLGERPRALQRSLDPPAEIGLLTQANAKSFSNKWIVLETPTPTFQAEWMTVLANVSN
jgi:hypothetical protein